MLVQKRDMTMSSIRLLLGVVMICVAALDAQAKPRTKSYPLSCDRVWEAVEDVAESKDYSSSMLDDKRHKAEVVTGHGIWTGKRTLYITLSGSGDTCEVAVEGTFSGITHNDKGDLFTRIEKSLHLDEKEKNSK
jgi:hypothetical protein